MTESVLIVLPLPSGFLSPNKPPASMGGRMRKAAIAKKYRKRAKEAALEAGIESGPWGRVTVLATFYHRQERRRDDVNFLASLKSAYDGLVDSGLLVDDDSEHLTTLPAMFHIDKKSPRVELRIERAK